ncbi:hypothetical protein, partial [Ectothiorhodospira variabilis]|uniref:hypothetical protein n=1 Tax=Ectothiorhodospira variabilis TaxID=505694 RepID=UPI001EFAC0D0
GDEGDSAGTRPEAPGRVKPLAGVSRRDAAAKPTGRYSRRPANGFTRPDAAPALSEPPDAASGPH